MSVHCSTLRLLSKSQIQRLLSSLAYLWEFSSIRNNSLPFYNIWRQHHFILLVPANRTLPNELRATARKPIHRPRWEKHHNLFFWNAEAGGAFQNFKLLEYDAPLELFSVSRCLPKPDEIWRNCMTYQTYGLSLLSRHKWFTQTPWINTRRTKDEFRKSPFR